MRRTGLFITILLGAGCSFNTVARESCQTDRECRARFGALNQCAADGYCEPAALTPRCNRTFPETSDDPSATPTLVLGSIVDQSLATHRARERSVQLAVQDANSLSTALGRRVSVVFCTAEENPEIDRSSRTDAAVMVARFLAEEIKVAAIIGPAASSDTQAAFQAIAGTGTLMISPSATSPALTGIDVTRPTDETPGLLWRTAAPDSHQGLVIAEDATRRMVGSVEVLAQTGAYGEGLAEVFLEAFDGEGRLLPFVSESDLITQLERAAAGDAEEILFISSQSSDVALFLTRAAAHPSLASRTFFLTDGAANQDALAGIVDQPDFTARIRGTRPTLPDGFVYRLFVASYDLAFEEDVTQFSFTANAHDAAWLAIYGAAWAAAQGEEVTGITMARGLRQLSSGADFDIRASAFSAVEQAFREGRSVNLRGASGNLDFAPTTEETTAPIDVWRLEGSQIVVDHVVDALVP